MYLLLVLTSIVEVSPPQQKPVCLDISNETRYRYQLGYSHSTAIIEITLQKQPRRGSSSFCSLYPTYRSRFPTNVLQILRLLDNSCRRHLSFPISPPQIIEDTHYFDRCPGDMDLLDVDSVDCGHGVLECRSSIHDGKQPMQPCVLWPVKGVVR